MAYVSVMLIGSVVIDNQSILTLLEAWLTVARDFFSLSLSFSIYCLTLAFEHYRQVYIVHSGLQDESLQVTITKLP